MLSNFIGIMFGQQIAVVMSSNKMLAIESAPVIQMMGRVLRESHKVTPPPKPLRRIYTPFTYRKVINNHRYGRKLVSSLHKQCRR